MKTFLLVENLFWTNENVFLSPFNKQKQRFVELEFEYFGESDVVNKLVVVACETEKEMAVEFHSELWLPNHQTYI